MSEKSKFQEGENIWVHATFKEGTWEFHLCSSIEDELLLNKALFTWIKKLIDEQQQNT